MNRIRRRIDTLDTLYSYDTMSLLERAELTARNAVSSFCAWVIPRRNPHDTRLRRKKDAAVRAEWDRYRALVAKALLRCCNVIREFARKRAAFVRRQEFEMLRNELSSMFVRVAAMMEPYGRFLSSDLVGGGPVQESWEALKQWLADECRQSLLAGK